MPRVTALVCAYWPERFDNVRQAVQDLQNGTVMPDRILVLNNNPSHQLSFEGAEVINSQANFECRGKFVAALLDVADYYLLLDDDTSVGPRTLECLLRYAHPGCCFGYLGCFLRKEDNSFHHGNRVWPHEITEETLCTTFCGCAMFMAFDAIVNMLALEEKVRLTDIGRHWPSEGDDILAGLANISSTVPMHGDERFVDLGYKGVAMAYEPGYFEMRDEFVKDVLKALETCEY